MSKDQDDPSMPHPDSLPLPLGVAADGAAFEMMRVWAGSEGLEVVMAPLPEGDAGLWGQFLAELMRRIAEEYRLREGAPTAETLARMRDAFEAEWADPVAGRARAPETAN